jgi:hypothetical protein
MPYYPEALKNRWWEIFMNIEIHTYDKGLVFDLLGKSSVRDEIQISDQIKLRYDGSYIRKAFGFPEIANFVLTFGSGMAAGVAANWLYDKLKGKKIERLIIERTEVEIDRGEIKKVIEEKLMVE